MGTSQIPQASVLPEYPRYSYPANLVLGLARSALRGQVYELHINPSTTEAGKNGVASYELMRHIAALLPDNLRGDLRIRA